MLLNHIHIRNVITIMALLCASALSLNAETKIVERSAKKAPEWVGTAVDGYLVISVRGKSLAEAQHQAEDEIAGRMVMSIARNINVGTKSVISESVVNNQVESSDEFTRTSAIRGANLPFLKGISLAKAEEIYWEKLRDKATKEEFYDYYVKYPFFRTEQAMLVAEFEEYDATKEADLNALESEIESLDSSEAIKAAISRAEALQKYFFDDVRQSRAANLLKRYKTLGKSIAMTGRFEGARKLKIAFQLNGHPFKVYALPKVTSNCASSLQVTPDGNGAFDVSYDNSDCLDDEENWIEVSTRVEGQKLSNRYNLSQSASEAASGKFSIVPQGKVIATADTVDAATNSISNLNIRFTLNNRGGTPFGLKSVELEFPGFSIPVVADNIDGVYTTKGAIQINLNVNGKFVISKQRSGVMFVNGRITTVNPDTQAIETVKLSLPFTCNWE